MSRPIEVFIIRDITDDTVVCVIDGAPSEDDAIRYASEKFPERIKGSLRGTRSETFEYEGDDY